MTDAVQGMGSIYNKFRKISLKNSKISLFWNSCYFVHKILLSCQLFSLFVKKGFTKKYYFLLTSLFHGTGYELETISEPIISFFQSKFSHKIFCLM